MTERAATGRAGSAVGEGNDSAVIIGLMSGTSLDGISAAVVRFTREQDGGRISADLLGMVDREYTPEQRGRLAAALRGTTPDEYCRLGFDLGDWLASSAIDAIATAGVARADVAAIASHGQTIWHEPGRATWQLGEAAVIAERTRVRVVSDFRVRDVAAGGQGAPLVPIADALLFASTTEWRALQNIGGIGNVTIVPPGGALTGVRAFDTGPGVVLIDGVVRELTGGEQAFDRDGVLAAHGQPLGTVVDALLAAPYFLQGPPKTTGRELFNDAYIRDLIARCHDARPDATTEDIVATAVAVTSRSIADAYDRFMPEPVTDVLLSGGGAKNPAVFAGLTAALAPRVVRLFDDAFFDGTAKEAVAFALLGYLHLRGEAGNVVGATGARGPRILGKVTPA